MLQGNFFDISNIETAGFEIKATLVINARHKIFDGHFPGQPVVPGVCMMQIVKEIMEGVVEKKLNLVKAAEMKFLAVINPQGNNVIGATVKYTLQENGQVLASASFFKDELIHFKFKGLFEFQ